MNGSYAITSGNACSPVIFEPITMSILMAQQKQLLKLKQQHNDAKRRNIRDYPVEKDKL